MHSDGSVKGTGKRLLAWALWFFLGWGGVHRLYLRRWRSGLAMLGISIYVALGIVLSRVFNVAQLAYGISWVFALLALLIWYITDLFRMPEMLRKST